MAGLLSFEVFLEQLQILLLLDGLALLFQIVEMQSEVLRHPQVVDLEVLCEEQLLNLMQLIGRDVGHACLLAARLKLVFGADTRFLRVLSQ